VLYGKEVDKAGYKQLFFEVFQYVFLIFLFLRATQNILQMFHFRVCLCSAFEIHRKDMVMILRAWVMGLSHSPCVYRCFVGRKLRFGSGCLRRGSRREGRGRMKEKANVGSNWLDRGGCKVIREEEEVDGGMECLGARQIKCLAF
jgi:hypothetical protein